MQHRRLAIPVAVVGSLGIALAPAIAEASSTATTAKANATAAAASAFAKFKTTFSSPASNTVKVAHRGSNAATANTAGPNPNLAFAVLGENTSGHSVAVEFGVTGLTTGTATFTINWGDQSTSTTTVTATGDTTLTSAIVPHKYATLGTYSISVTADDGQGDVVSNSALWCETGANYNPYGPVRILDTRNGTGAPTAPVASDGTLKLQVTGAGTTGDTIPAKIAAVVLNVTSVSPTSNGYLTVYGDDDASGEAVPNPGTSNLNFGAGENVANLVTVPVGSDGMVDIYNGSKGKTQVLADVAGYYTFDESAARYVAISPARILDTRAGTGTNGVKAQIPANGNVTVTIAGSDSGIIPAGADTPTAVAMNLTVVGGTKNGVITAYPDNGGTAPTVSNLNYGAGTTVANMSIVPVGNDGKIVFHNNSSGTVSLIADADGYYATTTTVATASSYVPFYAPQRYVDTRQPDQGGPLAAGSITYEPVSTFSTETGEVFNATVVQATGNGYLALYPFDPSHPGAVPGTSNLNYSVNQTIPNLVMPTDGTTMDQYGTYDVGIYVGGKGTVQLILDWFGSFMDQ